MDFHSPPTCSRRAGRSGQRRTRSWKMSIRLAPASIGGAGAITGCRRGIVRAATAALLGGRPLRGGPWSTGRVSYPPGKGRMSRSSAGSAFADQGLWTLAADVPAHEPGLGTDARARSPATGGGGAAMARKRLSDSDSLLWRMEADPLLRLPVLVVALLDRRPTDDGVRATIERACATVPQLRQRIVDPPLGLGPPRWVDADGVSYDHHVRRQRLPEGGDLRAVLDLVEPDAVSAFDPARPLWS